MTGKPCPLSAAELVYWEEFWLLEPFGDEWMQSSTIAAASMNGMGAKKQAGGHFIPDDFMPVKRQRKMSDRELEGNIELALSRSLRGK